MFKDWRIHEDSSNDYAVGNASLLAPPVGSVNSFKVVGPTGANLKRLIYVNNILRSIDGTQELSAAFRLKAGATNVRVGLFCMWDEESFDDVDNAYIIEMKAETSGLPTVRVRSGPSEGGSLILGPSPNLAFDHWYQLALQLKFDQVFNLQVRAYQSDAAVNSVLTPAYSLILGPVNIPRLQTKTGGSFGFFVESKQSSFETYIDHVKIQSQPVIV